MKNELTQIIFLLKDITDNPEGSRLFQELLYYMFATDESITVEQVQKTARQELTEKEEKLAMTVAEQLRKEGMQQGMQQGECAVLQRLIENRFGNIPDAYKKQLDQADSDMLLTWSERVLTAETLEEIFQD